MDIYFKSVFTCNWFSKLHSSLQLQQYLKKTKRIANLILDLCSFFLFSNFAFKTKKITLQVETLIFGAKSRNFSSTKN